MFKQKVVAVIVVLFAFLVVVSRELFSHSPQPAPRISVSDFRADNVIGRLGYPLGTVVRITGEVVEGSRAKPTAFTRLKILTVNGKRCEEVIEHLFHDHQDKPGPGSTFDFFVHEAGEFSGTVKLPDELGIQYPLAATIPFQYSTSLVIHKANNAESKP